MHLRTDEGVHLALGTQSQILLLALALRPGALVSRSTLIDALWGDDGSADGGGSRFRMAVARLREKLADAGLTDAIVSASSGYRLAVDDDEIDAVVFRRQLEHGRQLAAGNPEAAADVIASALGLWNGEAFGELAEQPWAVAGASELNELRLAAEEDLAALELALGRESDVVGRLRAAALAQPLRELRWMQLATAYYRLGRQTEALRALNYARTRLRDEIGVEPGLDFRRLERAILEHNPTLDDRQTVAARYSIGPAPIGRDDDVSAIVDLLRHNRVVTVVGLGGVGKTMLARTVLSKLAASLPSAFAALEGRTHESEIAVAIAGALGLGGGDEREMVSAIAARLGPTGVLVLDGAEGSPDSVGRLVDELGVIAPTLRVLIASRVPVGAIGEVRYALEPLALGDMANPGPAVELFTARAGMPRSALDDKTLAAVLRACERAAGLPLAIELLASSLDRYGLVALDGFPSNADHPVEQSLDAALSVIPEASRRLLIDTALLPDGVSLTTAAALAGVSTEEIRATIGPLAQLRLLEATADATGLRYRVLGPIRSAAPLLDANATEAEDRVLAMLRSVCTAVAVPGEDLDLSQLPGVEAEIGNLRHWLARTMGTLDGLELATVASTGLYHLGMGGEAVSWLQSHRAASPERDERTEIRSAVAMYRAHNHGSGAVDDIENLQRNLDTAERLGEWALYLFIAGYLAYSIGSSGDLLSALAVLERAQLNVHRVGARRPFFDLTRRQMVATGHIAIGDFSVLDELAEVAKEFEAHGYPYKAASALYSLANAARLSGDPDRARAALWDAKRHLREGHDFDIETAVDVELAQLAHLYGDPSAVELMQAAIANFERCGSLRMAARHRMDMGLWLLDDGESERGQRELREALPVLIRRDSRGASVGVATLARLMASSDPSTAGRLAAAAARWVFEGSGTNPTPEAVEVVINTARELAGDDVVIPSDDEVVQLVIAG